MDSTEKNDSNSTQVEGSTVQNTNSEAVTTQSANQVVKPTETEISIVESQNIANDPTNNKKNNNKRIIGIVVAIVLVLIIGGVLVALFLTGVIKLGGGDASEGSTPTPTPELAKSVCEKYEGEYYSIDAPDDLIQSAHYCEKTMNDGDNSVVVFSYEIHFLSDTGSEEYQKRIESIIVNEPYSVLENTDEYKKVYKSTSDSKYVLTAVYKNVGIDIMTISNISFAEGLLVELGFPDAGGSEFNNVINEQGSSSSNTFHEDTEYRDDLSKLVYSMTQYQANNYGRLPKISDGKLVDFDSYLDTRNFVDEATGDRYSLIPFDSFADSKFGEDDSLLNSIPSNQIYVFYQAECDDNRVTAAENPRKAAFVHSSTNNDSYYCMGN